MKDILTEELNAIRRVRAKHVKDHLLRRESTPAGAARVKLRSALADNIVAQLQTLQLSPEKAASRLRTTPQRLCDLQRRELWRFGIDELVEMAHHLRLDVHIDIRLRNER